MTNRLHPVVDADDANARQILVATYQTLMTAAAGNPGYADNYVELSDAMTRFAAVLLNGVHPRELGLYVVDSEEAT